MGTGLTDINDRLTPSAPIEITFAAQPITPGRKITTLFGHRNGGNGIDYGAYDVVNVGDPDAARAEVEVLAGVGSQLALMAQAFVKANSAVSDPRNFSAFRVVLLPSAELHFGPANEAIDTVKGLRSDMLVSCYAAGDATNLTTLVTLAQLISGIDRDLQGQFGSFVCVGSIEALATQIAYAINKREVIVASIPDTNTALVNTTGDVTLGSNIISNLLTTVGVNKGAQITALGVPANTTVEQVTANSITMSANATATHAAEAVAFQNVISQNPEIVAAAHAAVMMQSAFPYNPLQNVVVGGLIAPQKASDRIDINPNGASEQALVAGLSPLFVKPNGDVALLRTRTTFNQVTVGVAATAYFDWQDLVTLYDFREVCYGITQNPPFNGNPGGTKASATIAARLKDEILREAMNFENLNAFQGVKTLSPLFIVAPSTTSHGRFDFKIPVNVIPGLYVIAGNIQAVSGLGDFTL